MFEPFIWMFKTDNFKQHFIYLFFTYIKFFVIAITFLILGVLLPQYFIASIVCYVLSGLFFIAPILCVQGYFWELTESIISRDWDISTANIYNGKIKQIFTVHLPEIKTFKFIWRGIASIVATILMFIPFVLLMASGTFLAAVSSLPVQTALLLYLFICTFIPALLWNYAARDSVFAVWNLRKAIYIMGNYTGKYILNTVLFIIFYLADYFLLALMAFLSGAHDTSSLLSLSLFAIVKLVLFYLFSYVQYIYCLYVYAYLLGTIAPPAEG